jgi:hypothetical protein
MIAGYVSGKAFQRLKTEYSQSFDGPQPECHSPTSCSVMSTMLKNQWLPVFGPSNGFKDGVRYMMGADVDKLRTALGNGDYSTRAFALCSMKDWITTTGKEEKQQ